MIPSEDIDDDGDDTEKVDIFDLALRKLIDNKISYTQGQNAEYLIDVFNQGNENAYAVEITDYLNEGYLFDESVNAGLECRSNEFGVCWYIP